MAGFGAIASRLKLPRNAVDAALPSGPRQLAPQPTQLGTVTPGDKTTRPDARGRLLLKGASPIAATPRVPVEPTTRRKGRLAAAGNLLLNPAEVAS